MKGIFLLLFLIATMGEVSPAGYVVVYHDCELHFNYVSCYDDNGKPGPNAVVRHRWFDTLVDAFSWINGEWDHRERPNQRLWDREKQIVAILEAVSVPLHKEVVGVEKKLHTVHKYCEEDVIGWTLTNETRAAAVKAARKEQLEDEERCHRAMMERLSFSTVPC